MLNPASYWNTPGQENEANLNGRIQNTGARRQKLKKRSQCSKFPVFSQHIEQILHIIRQRSLEFDQ
ncbi:MAG: hypothetical protein JW715_05075, partial [Sedimentisphaerales bacterium]|nr:hypothetical protein [Sedimentisphaerales bacterium]